MRRKKTKFKNCISIPEAECEKQLSLSSACSSFGLDRAGVSESDLLGRSAGSLGLDWLPPSKASRIPSISLIGV